MGKFSLLWPKLYIKLVYKATLSFTHRIQNISRSLFLFSFLKKCKAKIYTFTLFSADATMYFFCPLRKFSITNLIAHIINYIYSIVAYKATVYKTGTRAISTSCTLTHGSIQVIKYNLIVLLTSFSLKFSLHLILR